MLTVDVLARMPRFYFHLYNDETIHDDEGTELPNETVALESAARMAREMAAQNVRDGRLVLAHRIEVRAQNDTPVGTIHFRDVVRVES